MRHVHLDPLGGIAGDMFVAALLDAFPDHAADTLDAARALSGAGCALLTHHDGFGGRRFDVRAPEEPEHDHAWRNIRDRIRSSDLPDAVQGHALGIFTQLADAEAHVHGVAPDAVRFHEVGAADSIADIVAAAWLIARLDASSWSVGPLPLGGGRVQTEHGPMPVPAPATARLLEGFCLIDDGIAGERVTPTGAAILRYLGCTASPPAAAARLVASGVGFGSRKMRGLPNALRVLVFESAGEAPVPPQREVCVIEFEVDDQSAEDLASGLDRLRAEDGVLDVVQWPAFGKKGRMATHVQILLDPARLAAVTDACFRETTTTGLRTQIVGGYALRRRMELVSVGEHQLRVKLVDRPGGRSAKAESDDVRALEDHAVRASLRRRAEELAEARARAQSSER